METSVFRMPRVMPKLDMSRKVPVQHGDMVYVGFFDIGIRSEVTTRRMHLLAPPEQQVAWENALTATRVLENAQSVLSRCLSHVRVLDVHRTGRDRVADSLGESYDMSLWNGPLYKRMLHLRKHLAGKSSTSSAASSAGWNTWQSRSSGSDWQSDRWQSQQWPSVDPGAHDRSVRSRSGNR